MDGEQSWPGTGRQHAYSARALVDRAGPFNHAVRLDVSYLTGHMRHPNEPSIVVVVVVVTTDFDLRVPTYRERRNGAWLRLHAGFCMYC